ncbi:TPA: DNA primase, partial [Streptococcus suis]|nr:DNA primase [Streptococcus suis]
PGIFNRAMEGLRQALSRRDFSISATMRESVEKWEKGNDVVAMFLEDECEIGSDKKSAVSEVYPTYKQYCIDSGYKPLAKNSFNQRMVELGFENKLIKIGKKPVRSWVGFCLNDGF